MFASLRAAENCSIRLALSADIIEDIVHSLHLRDDDRLQYKQLLSTYRKTAFHLYQNSLCTLRQWQSLSAGIPGARSERELQLESRAGMRSLLCRDLRNWVSHSRTPEAVWGSVSTSLRKAILSQHSDPSESYRGADAAHNYAMFFLAAFSEPSKTESAGKAWERQLLLTPLIQHFHQFQASWEPDLWFDKWVGEFKMPSSRRFKRADSYLSKLHDVLRDCSGPTIQQTSHLDWLGVFEKAWSPTTLEDRLSETFLADLLNSGNIKQLSQRSGVSEPAMRILVGGIQQACIRVLNDAAEKGARAIPAAGSHQANRTT
jgi:hypothetical protein